MASDKKYNSTSEELFIKINEVLYNKEEKLKALKFYFYSNGKLFIGKQHSSDYFDKSILNRYYVVKHDTQTPRKNCINLNEEIQPDSITLTKAGFKYVIYYEHDIPTNTYIKKHKWE